MRLHCGQGMYPMSHWCHYSDTNVTSPTKTLSTHGALMGRR
jgi:hypothetical protein